MPSLMSLEIEPYDGIRRSPRQRHVEDAERWCWAVVALLNSQVEPKIEVPGGSWVHGNLCLRYLDTEEVNRCKIQGGCGLSLIGFR